MKIPQSHLHQFLQNQNTDGILVTKKENIFWLTGFWGSFGLFIQMKKGEKFLLTDNRYFEHAKKLAQKNDFTPVLVTPDNEADVSSLLGKQTIFLESSTTLRKQEWCQKVFSQTKFVTKNNFLETLRKEKTEAEIDKIKKAQARVDEILVPFLRSNLKKNITEKELAFRLEIALRDQGRFELSFPLIVAFGKNSAIPHHESSDQRLQPGDNVLIDCGAKYEHFCSDMTRNFCFESVNQEYLTHYEQLKRVQKKTLEHFLVGKKIAAIEQFCRDQLQKKAPFFTHSLGHGVGLEIHEEPRISLKSKDVLHENEVVTCEPGLYFPGKFGIRIEDLLVIRSEKPEVLSVTDKELLRISEETDIKKLC